MKIAGEMLIGASTYRGSQEAIYAIDPATGEKLEPVFHGGGAADVERACELADTAFDSYRETSPESRGHFLETIAQNILGLGDALIERAMAETGLPRARLEGERARTVAQLRLFAAEVRAGRWVDARIDQAQPKRQPLPRSDLRMRYIPLGPVAVFGASNFPLAFSVAGGDTASALAAGAPVVVKGHSAHPGTSELVGRAIQAAVHQCHLPPGVFSLLFGSGREIGTALVADRRIKAVGFTGSRTAGMALMRVAAGRPEPIPVYAEMSSINPLFVLPQALSIRAADLARGFVGSLLLGAGQFCTSPGLVIARQGEDLECFLSTAGQVLSESPAAVMLNPQVHAAYEHGVRQLVENKHAQMVARGRPGEGPYQCRSALFVTSAADFLADRALSAEVFGSSSLVIRCANDAEMLDVARHLEGQLTASVHLEPEDDDTLVRGLMACLELKAGRVLFNGFPTGVEVCQAMVHGGPFPATSDSRSTSVGTAAIERFLRPVCYQDVPDRYLPDALKDGNPFNLPRLLDGKRG